MSPLKTYKDVSGSLYTLQLIDLTSVAQHCQDYLDYIELSNNCAIDDFERSALIEDMESAVNSKSAFEITVNGELKGYIYLKQEGKFVHFISVLHAIDIDGSPIPKLLLLDKVYESYMPTRMYPKDIYSMPYAAILDHISYRIFRHGSTETVKLKPAIWGSSFISFLGLEEV